MEGLKALVFLGGVLEPGYRVSGCESTDATVKYDCGKHASIADTTRIEEIEH